MAPDARVVVIKARGLSHPWDGRPCLVTPKIGPGFYGRSLPVDPFPAYPHDAALAARELERVARAYPLPAPVQVAVMPFESHDRTNGHCSIEHDYRGKKPYPWAASIVLWGKRIPPHPAMTRYLVAHEYGHAVAAHMARVRGDGDENDMRTFYREYRALRGRRRAPAHGGGGSWHVATAEVFANDFRILVTGTELEFWPHAGTKRPEDVAAVRKFWQEAVKAKEA